MAVISQPTIRRIWSFVMVMFVMGVIQVITFFGVKYIYLNFLPEAGELSFYLHWLLCFCLWVNTTLNYAEAVLRDPGFVQWNLSTVGRTLEGYTFCNKCQQGKPPGSHHCSICRRCVQNMDHHCPFIGNCVGRSNRRAFVLFLFWSASSLAYVLTITVIHCFDRSEDIARNVRQATEFLPQLKLETLPFYLNRLINHTYTGVHLQAVAFLLLLGSVTFLMTFSLLIQQARLISEGQTTISRLQAQRLARQKHRMGLKENQTETVQGKSTSCLQNWEDVFGRPWWSFLLPRIPLSRNPSGAAKTV
eukprot:Skav223132  [mRNA]  locus=scaffold470:101770:102681:+ [translate_table: standard]